MDYAVRFRACTHSRILKLHDRRQVQSRISVYGPVIRNPLTFLVKVGGVLRLLREITDWRIISGEIPESVPSAGLK